LNLLKFGLGFALSDPTNAAGKALRTLMPSKRICQWLPGLLGSVAGPTSANPVEGDFATNAGALLVILGVVAILLGIRNLRALRHRPPAVRQAQTEASRAPTKRP
jgi:hypothetical protein